jgi:hypothetical protein
MKESGTYIRVKNGPGNKFTSLSSYFLPMIVSICKLACKSSLRGCPFLIVTLLFFAACTEPYNFSIDSTVESIVVDGLITDQVESYTIQLHQPSGYGNTSNKPVTGANVTVTDNLGNTYIFTEDNDKAGIYTSNSAQFTGIPGLSYILHIHTTAGEDFQSASQLLPPAQKIDTVYGEKSFEYFQNVDANGNYISYKADGINVFLDIKNRNEGNQNYRLLNTIYLQYTYQFNIPYSPFNYCWTKYSPAIPGDGMCLINNTDEAATSEIKKLKFSFIPFDRSFYRIIDIATMAKFSLLIKQYRMNNETSDYYMNIDKQLKAEGRLFDPIATQLKGNILCVNNKNKAAYGFFEASSKTTYTYSDESYNWVQKPIFKFRAINLDTIPDNGISSNEPPLFWIY